MGRWEKFFLAAVCAAFIPGWAAAQGQPANVDQEIDRIIAREHEEVQILRRFSPLIETYIQDMKPDRELGLVPFRDHYFLGLAELNKGVVDRSMTDEKKGLGQQLNPLSHLGGLFSSSYVPEGFLQMIFIDANNFDRQHYRFDYVRREFLGEVRCYVFDVTPLPHSGKGRFKGRLWAEEQGNTIVRFSGVYLPAARLTGSNVHFDSWRMNVAPNLWVPALIYSQESDLRDFPGGHLRFKAQTRLWGYNLKNVGRQSEFSEITVDAATPVKDQAGAAQDISPIEAERAWQHQAEVNVLDRLERIGLIAPPGEVEKVLDTVVNNLEVTNNLDIQPELHCRVLLTSTLESFSIGHTIVISRGLLDVLPDEASLAATLAQEIGQILVGQPLDDRWAFGDEALVSTVDALRHFSFRDDPHDLELASKKAVELLKNSPYKDRLGNAGLFLRQLQARAKLLPALINPRLGNEVYLTSALLSAAPALETSKLNQIAALPLGSRVKLNPWTDRVELVKSKPVALLSEREKMPLEVTPFMPYLTRYDATSSLGPTGGPTKADVANKKSPE